MIRRRDPRLLRPAAVGRAELDRLLDEHAVSSVFVAAHVERIRAGGRATPPVYG
ncbi:GNAT family N-acetyltransferase, partial [Kocuria sp. HSID17582]